MSYVSTSTIPINIIYKNSFSINFEDEELNAYCTKINEKYISFNINFVEVPEVPGGNVIPLYKINSFIKNKKTFDLTILIFNNPILIFNNPECDCKYVVLYLENVRFRKIKNLINFSYKNKNKTITTIKVRYKYEELKLFNNLASLNLYRRKKKLQQINQAIICRPNI